MLVRYLWNARIHQQAQWGQQAFFFFSGGSAPRRAPHDRWLISVGGGGSGDGGGGGGSGGGGGGRGGGGSRLADGAPAPLLPDLDVDESGGREHGAQLVQLEDAEAHAVRAAHALRADHRGGEEGGREEAATGAQATPDLSEAFLRLRPAVQRRAGVRGADRAALEGQRTHVAPHELGHANAFRPETCGCFGEHGLRVVCAQHPPVLPRAHKPPRHQA
mmetsp:Transcript_12081/g.31516  ORF Transcript_12081/g.31516 Transcript_12081/m.31516 type:complete len:218 (+) Transcript_12081:58-711(+)